MFLAVLLSLFMISPSALAIGGSCSASLANTKSATKFAPQLIEGVIRLSDRDAISEDIFKQFSPKDIAEALVDRIRQQENEFARELVQVAHQEPVNLRDDTDIILFFWRSDVASIREKGFLNQFDVQRSRGYYSPGLRKTAEDQLTGLQLGNFPQSSKLRPKSAFLNIRSDKEFARKTDEVNAQYGNVGAVLKAELKDRAIWTAADSLEIGMKKSDGSSKSLMPWRGTFDRNRLPTEGLSDDYYEALVFGPIEITDVDYFLVFNQVTADAVKNLGRPVYLGQMVFRNNRVVFEKGSLLHNGNETDGIILEAPSVDKDTPEIIPPAKRKWWWF